MFGPVSGSSETLTHYCYYCSTVRKTRSAHTLSQVHSLFYNKHELHMLQQELPDGVFYALQPLVCSRHSLDAQHLHVSPFTSPLLGLDG